MLGMKYEEVRAKINNYIFGVKKLKMVILFLKTRFQKEEHASLIEFGNFQMRFSQILS